MTREMKDSGIAWIGEIPSKWRVSKIYKYFGERRNINVLNKESNRLSLSYGNVIIKPIEDSNGLVPESYSTYNIVEPNDIIIRPTDLQNDKKSLRTGLVHNHGIITSAYISLMPLFSFDSRYFHYLLHIYDEKKVFYNMGNGVRQGLTFDLFKTLPVLVPPIEERANIIDYLDSQCLKIDRLLNILDQQIETLKEYKKSVITQAVTKGLDPDVEMKDSGVEWIGEIPKHWNVCRIKNKAEVVLGKMIQSVQNNESETLENYLCAANVLWSGIDPVPHKQMYFSPVEKSQLKLCIGDLCVTEGGSHAGESAIFSIEKGEYYFQNSVNRIRSFSGDNRFLFYWIYFLWHQGWIPVLCSTISMPHYTKEKVEDTLLIYPPTSEEKEISDYLDEKCSNIDNILENIHKQKIELAKYKKSLIFDYVTGKKEVPSSFLKKNSYE